MIHYALKCANGHEFESWFQSADAFDKLVSAGMVACVVCGGTDVEKAIMAPRVRTARATARAEEDGAEQGAGPLSQPASPAEQAIAELRRKVEENADYVGRDFTTRARAMHEGEEPVRPIYGEAAAEDARQLVDEGVPVVPLPFPTGRKTN